MESRLQASIIEAEPDPLWMVRVQNRDGRSDAAVRTIPLGTSSIAIRYGNALSQPYPAKGWVHVRDQFATNNVLTIRIARATLWTRPDSGASYPIRPIETLSLI